MSRLERFEAAFNKRFPETKDKVIAIMGGWVGLGLSVKYGGKLAGALLGSCPPEKVDIATEPVAVQSTSGSSSEYGFEVPTVDTFDKWAENPSNVKAWEDWMATPGNLDKWSESLEK